MNCIKIFISTRSLQRQFELSTIDIHAAGNERWKRRYVYWIPALHIEDKEVIKGRWEAEDVNKALDDWENGLTEGSSDKS